MSAPLAGAGDTLARLARLASRGLSWKLAQEARAEARYMRRRRVRRHRWRARRQRLVRLVRMRR